ncbi:MAG: XisI protein [Anaerolineae bacterium]|nr:XisI protein [Anaerolineae bacterium]
MIPKVWIQYDGAESIAADLVDAGIPKEAIVLGFRPPALRILLLPCLTP